LPYKQAATQDAVKSAYQIERSTQQLALTNQSPFLPLTIFLSDLDFQHQQPAELIAPLFKNVVAFPGSQSPNASPVASHVNPPTPLAPPKSGTGNKVAFISKYLQRDLHQYLKSLDS